MNFITIFLLICVALVINFFRWSKDSYDGRLVTWVFTLIVGVILALTVTTYPDSQKYNEIQPFKVEYATFLDVNFIAYKTNKDDGVIFTPIGKLDEEKKKKFYEQHDYNYVGIEIKKSVIRGN